MLKQVIILFWSICRFQQGPEAVPRSWFLLGLVSVVFIATYTVQFIFNDMKEFLSLPTAFYHCCVLFFSIAFFCATVLILRGVYTRYRQTLASLLGTQCLINLFVIPLFFIAPIVLVKNPESVLVFLLGVAFFLIILALNVWHLMVNAFIFQHALNIGFMLALLISFSNMGFNLIMYSHLT